MQATNTNVATIGDAGASQASSSNVPSGSASAVGVSSANAIANSATASVRIGGTNDAAVTAGTSNSTTLADAGTAVARSGDSPATSAGVAGRCATGLLATTSVIVRQEQTAARGPGPIGVIQVADAQIRNAGSSLGESPTLVAIASPGPSDASGGERAAGVVAENRVLTSGQVVVRIGGANKGPIEALVETITRIFNGGAAAAGPASVPSPGPHPGSAIGASTRSDIAVTSSAGAYIDGDNHNPIDIFLELIGRIWSWGRASGSGEALGLQADNRVDLTGRIDIQVTGTNYAPIRARLRLITEIDNLGEAEARSAPSTASENEPTSDGAVPEVAASGAVACVGTDLRLGLVNAQTATAPASVGAARNSAAYLVDQRGSAECASGDAIATRSAESGSAMAIGNRADVGAVSVQDANAAAVASTRPTAAPAPIATPSPTTSPRPTATAPAVTIAAASGKSSPSIVAAVVTQPSAPRGRANALVVSRLPATATDPTGDALPETIALLALPAVLLILTKKGVRS